MDSSFILASCTVIFLMCLSPNTNSLTTTPDRLPYLFNDSKFRTNKTTFCALLFLSTLVIIQDEA